MAGTYESFEGKGEDAHPRKGRLEGLDALRGAAVAGMILVTSPGSWDFAYAQLKHAAWNGVTSADMVFPTFLFAVGMALGLSFPRTFTLQERRAAWIRVVRRALSLILLGLFLNLLPSLDVSHLRIPGILQRIGLCYGLVGSLILLTTLTRHDGRQHINSPVIAGALVFVLMSYWAISTWLPVPGFGPGRLDPEGNIGAYIDRSIFTIQHLWPYGTAADGRVVYDPEGLLTTWPATANVLFGVLAACAWRRRSMLHILWKFALAGLVLAIFGEILDPFFVINKRIWTSTFVLFSSGVSMIALAMFCAASSSRLGRTITWPLRVLGSNAITAFVISTLLGAVAGLAILPGGATPQQAGYALARGLIADPYGASLLCAVAILSLVTLLLVPLHHKGIHMRL